MPIFSRTLQYHVSRFILQINPETLDLSLPHLPSAHLFPKRHNKMLQDTVWRLGSVRVWSIFVSSNNIFSMFVGSDMSDYLLSWKLSTSMCITCGGFTCICLVIHNRHTAILVDSFNMLSDFRGKCHSVARFCTLYPILFQFDGIHRYW